MSSEEDRLRRSKRKHKARMKMLRQYQIAKDYECLPTGYEDTIHIFNKHKSLNCGNSNCTMCGNPRKFFGQKTLQEIKHELDDPFEELDYESDRDA